MTPRIPQHDEPRVRITDPKHPHYPETGWWTGEVIKVIWGGTMGKVRLDHCPHGNDACFVSPGQIAQIPEAEGLVRRKRAAREGDDR